MEEKQSRLQRFIGPTVLMFYILAVAYVYVMDKSYESTDITSTVNTQRKELKKNQQIVQFSSKNPFNIYDLFYEYDTISDQDVYGVLTIPEDASEDKLPLIIGVAGSGGWREHHSGYLERYNQDGFATLELHSFNSRNVVSTVGEQISCTVAMMIHDSYMALHSLSKHPRIDGQRVGITGWSLGGGVALFSAWKPLKDAISPDHSFAAHLPIYPPCISKPETVEFTDAPIHIMIGALDDWVPADACEDLVKDMEDSGAKATIKIYPNSHHSFDELTGMGIRKVEHAYSVKDCRVTLGDDGIIYTENYGFPMSSPALQKIGLYFCAERGSHWGGNDTTRVEAESDAREFMNTHLLKK